MSTSRPRARPGAVDAVVGANTRMLRRGKGLTQGQVGERMRARGYGWSHNTIGFLERGQRTVLLAEALDLARCLDVPLDRLLQEPAP